MVQLVSRHSCVADRLPVVVRFPAGPRVRLKTVDPPKGNGLGQKKSLALHIISLLFFNLQYQVPSLRAESATRAKKKFLGPKKRLFLVRNRSKSRKTLLSYGAHYPSHDLKGGLKGGLKGRLQGELQRTASRGLQGGLKGG